MVRFLVADGLFAPTFLQKPFTAEKELGKKFIQLYCNFLENDMKFSCSESKDVLKIYKRQYKKMKVSIENFFSKCDQIHKKLWIWSHFLKKSLMKIFNFLCNVTFIIFVVVLLSDLILFMRNILNHLSWQERGWHYFGPSSSSLKWHYLISGNV